MAIRQPKHRPTPPKRPAWQSRYHGVRMTPEEYLSLPEEKPYLEYIDGMVVQKPMVNTEHALLAVEIALRLRLWADPLQAGKVGVEARMKAGDLPNYRLPDVSFWAAGTPGDDDLPTLAVEIRSPGQTLAELRTKCRFLRTNGVAACWLIDPATRSAEIFEAERDGEATTVLEATALPGFSLTLEELFAVLGE
jgi:Uma2 family endonuclease